MLETPGSRRAMCDEIQIRHFGNIHIIELGCDGVPDQLLIARFQRRIERLLQTLNEPKLVINLSNLHYMPSAMIGALIAINNEARRRQGELRVASLMPMVMEMFKLSKIDKVLNLYKTPNDALRAF